MPAQIADLRAKVSIEGADKAKKDLKELKGGSGSSGGGGILDVAAGFKAGLGAVTGFFTGFAALEIVHTGLDFLKDQIGDIIKAGMDQQAVEAQTAAVLKSMGRTAEISAGQIGDTADSLARLTGVSDDTVQSAENILLTFSQISGKALPQVTGLVLDLSQAFHQDLQSSAVMVGKALNDPIAGVTALRRVGVQLSQQQQESIKHFVAVGNVAAAQNIIIKELTKQVGGSAEAYGKTFPGQVARFNVALDQAKEKIGLAVIPILQSLMEKYVMPLADWLGAHLPAAIDTLTHFLDNELLPAVNNLMNSPVVTTLEGWAKAIMDKVTPAVDHRGLAGGVSAATGKMKDLSKQAGTTGGDLDPTYTKHVNAAVTSIYGLADSIDPQKGDNAPGLVPAMRRADKQMDATVSAQSNVNKQAQNESIPVLSGLGEKWNELTNWIGQFANEVNIRLPGVTTNMNHFGQLTVQAMGDQTGNLRDIWEGFWAWVSMPVRLAGNTVETIVIVMMDIIGGHMERVGDDIKNGFSRAWDIVKDGFGGLLRFIRGIGGELVSAITFPFRMAWQITKSLLDDFGKQLRSWWSNMLYNLQQFINDHAPKFPTIQPPNIGGWFGQQRASGGPVSGDFLGAERGMELLVTPGVYHAPAGSYVYNASQTRDILSNRNNGGMASRSGDTFNITIVGANKTASELFADIKREADRMKRITG